MSPRRAFLLGILLTSSLLLTTHELIADSAHSEGEKVFYQDQIASPPGVNTQVWSEPETVIAPGNGKILHGLFLPQPVVISLPNLPDHGWVKLRFKLYIIGSWDGSSRVWGPDLWSLQVRGGQRLFFTTFGNLGNFFNNNVQSFPDEYPWGRNPDWTGAEIKDVLNFPRNGGYSMRAELLNDSVYPMEAIFPHSSNSLVLDFTAIYDDPPQEHQTWGISDLEVTTMKTPPFVEDSAFPKLWEDLASRDPMNANAAMWRLVSAGDRAVTFISEKVKAMYLAPKPMLNQSTPQSITLRAMVKHIVSLYFGQAKPLSISSPGVITAPFSGLEALRLHRAHRVLKIINGNDLGAGFKIDHLVPEYFQDLKPEPQP
jgi:hypothetical protein